MRLPNRALGMMAAALLVAWGGPPVRAQWAVGRGEVTFPDKTRVRVEIADTESTRQRGLMFRKSLGPDEGMLFVFDAPGFYPFWMKNTLIPLDMLWLDREGRVVSIASAVPPCRADPCPSYPPAAGTTALYVVEVNAGFAKQHGVKVADVLRIAVAEAR
jgi:uncharacterized membrane protein (UPF0127 family)